MMLPTTSLNRRALVASLLRYSLVGGVAALTEWLVYALFLYQIGLNYLLSALVAFAVATAVNYGLSLVYVFQGATSPHI
jgi:putative flippase GtrA